MDWSALGSSIEKLGLPLLGAVLPIPGGAAIGTALASALGADSANPGDILTALTASADAQLKAKQFEATHQETMMQLQLKYQTDMYADEVSDRNSARQREMSVKDHTPTILAALVVSLYIGVQWFLLTRIIDPGMRDIVMRSLGTLDSALGLVLAYYFGSSASSRTKDETIKSAVQNVSAQ